MFLRDLGLVGPHEMALADDFLAADVETIDSVGPREDEPGDEIVGAAELQAVRPPDGEVGALSRRELADIVAAEHRQRVAGRLAERGLHQDQRAREEQLRRLTMSDG